MDIPILRIPFSEEDKKFIHLGLDQILRSGFLTMGKYTRQFEEMFAEFIGVRYAVSCNSGTAALELVLRALGIEGKSVIVPTNTFLATTYAVMHSGNRVIFADSEPATLALDVADVKQRLTDDTAAIILVHIGGIISPAVYELRKLCHERSLFLIEDCAHAHGCTVDGQHAGTLGVAGAFSFFPTKVLTTGEGGMVTTNDQELARRIGMIRNHGKNPDLSNRMSEYGYNYRMSELNALLGVQQMKKASEIIQERRWIAEFYDKHLEGIPGLRPLKVPANVTTTHYKYVVFLHEEIDRGETKSILKQRFGVSLTGEVYSELCHSEPLWQRFTYCGRQHRNGGVACHRWPGCRCGDVQEGFPGAEYVSRHHICLPVYPGLSADELEHVVNSLRQVLLELKRG